MENRSLLTKLKRNEKLMTKRFVMHCLFYLKSVLKNKELCDKALKTLDQFGVEFRSQEDKKRLFKDMMRMYRKHGFDFSEYLLYHFKQKTMEERLTFVADWEHTGYALAMNDSKNNDLYDNKWNTYEKYKEYYRRDVLYCDHPRKKEQFIRFIEKHGAVIVKPISESCGRGIRIVHANDKNVSFDTLYNEFKGCFIVEELICQAESMKKFHPNSVNTVRMPTIRINENVLILHPFMRVGTKGQCVDNAGAGGIFGLIDVETGAVINAVDEFGHSYISHPDTNEKIVGFHIPQWDELKQIVGILTSVVPENRYTSWDFALTDKGWCIVEVNRRGQFVWQIPLQIGFRKEINSILNKLNLKY